MIGFLSAPENLPFTVALTVMLAIAILEGITTLLGMAVSGFFETLIPDIDFDIDADTGDIHATSGLTKLLGWLRIGKVPFLMLLIIFLTAFGLLGLLVQSTTHSMTGILMPAWLAVFPTFVLSLPVVRMFGGLLEKFMPQDETEAVSENSFIGRTATITLGTASAGSPAQAKLRDEFGQTHYLMVQPDVEGDVFETKEVVLIVKKAGSVYNVIKSTNEALVD